MSDQTNGQQDNTGSANEPTFETLRTARDTAWTAYETEQTPENKTAYLNARKAEDDFITSDITKRAELAKANVAPEKYDVKLPENSVLTPEHIAALSSYAKEKKLTNEQAQELLNRDNQLIESDRAAQQKASDERVAKMQESWIATAKDDKEIGGAEFAANAELASRVVKKFGTPEFNELLNPADGKGIKWGNHPELFRFLAKLGKAMSPDKLESGNNQDPAKANQSYADKFYETAKAQT